MVSKSIQPDLTCCPLAPRVLGRWWCHYPILETDGDSHKRWHCTLCELEFKERVMIRDKNQGIVGLKSPNLNSVGRPPCAHKWQPTHTGGSEKGAGRGVRVGVGGSPFTSPLRLRFKRDKPFFLLSFLISNQVVFGNTSYGVMPPKATKQSSTPTPWLTCSLYPVSDSGP